jgi:hypothetical protein
MMESSMLKEGTRLTDLPARLAWKSIDFHAMRCTSWTRSRALWSREILALSRASRKLYSQTLAHEVRAMKGYKKVLGHCVS